MADIVKNFGKTKIIDTGTITKIVCDGDTLLEINHGSGDINLFTGGVLSATSMWVNPSTGVAEKLYVEGATRMTGYLVMSGGAGTYLQTPTLTSTQRDALTPVAGMVIYNSTTTKLQCYAGGTWNDLH